MKNKLRVFKFAFILGLIYLIALGFYFNYRFANKEIKFIFENTPVENSLFRKLVYVSGEVKNPGVYEFEEDKRIVEVIGEAGGFTENADSNFVAEKLNLAERLKDEQKIFIPAKSGEKTTSENSEANDTSDGLVNINTASATILDSLPGIGPSTAQKIIDNRPFSAKEELMNVSGIGESKYGQIVDLITL